MTTRETVDTETLASLATSRIVALACESCPLMGKHFYLKYLKTFYLNSRFFYENVIYENCIADA